MRPVIDPAQSARPTVNYTSLLDFLSVSELRPLPPILVSRPQSLPKNFRLLFQPYRCVRLACNVIFIYGSAVSLRVTNG